MNLNKYIIVFVFAFLGTSLFAGNPDRQGEAGAYELLMLPWARTAGLNGLNTSFVSGVESMRVNPAGISRINNTEFSIGNADYLRSTNTKLTALGISQKVGKDKNGAIGISLMAVDFGDIAVTTTDQPGGTGATFTPSFFNIGLGYAYTFDNKISVGILFRMVSESTSDVSAIGMGLDAGVQYVSGENDAFKFGISLRNVGTKLGFEGEGLSISLDPDGPSDQISLNQKAAEYELPTQLNIGMSYDFYFSSMTHRLTPLMNFTGNSFARDQIGVGMEYSFKKLFMLRGSYEMEIGSDDLIEINNVYTGLSFGASVLLPLSKKNDTQLSFDYAYRTTDIFDGTHNFGLTLKI